MIPERLSSFPLPIPRNKFPDLYSDAKLGLLELPGHPIQFIYTDTHRKFRIGPAAMKMLKSLEEPVALVSVCGRARQGKSSLLNQLLGESSGFEVSKTLNTNGLWLWSSPLWRIAPDGTSYNLLIMDTVSIDANYTVGRSSLQLISLACLLSSMLVYNQMGSIDDVALHILYRIVEMTKHIHLQASQGTDATSVLEQCSPLLLFLLRDFRLGLVEDNHMITPKEYLEHTLGTVRPSENAIAASRSKMRESIRGFFPDRDCHTLVRPIIDENLGQLDHIMSERLRTEFRDGLAHLKTFVLERTIPKKVSGGVMTGPILLNIAQMFLDVLNRDAAPYSWQSDEETVYLKAYGDGEGCFLRGVKSRCLDEVSEGFLEERLQLSLSIFNYECDRANLGSGPMRDIYRMCLKSALEKKFLELMKAEAERVTNGNIANKHPAVESLNPHGAAQRSSNQDFLGLEVTGHSEEYPVPEALSFGLQSRRKKPGQHSQKEFRAVEDGIGFASSLFSSSYDASAGEVYNLSKLKFY